MKKNTLADRFIKAFKWQNACAGCGAENIATARFCGKCGQRVRAKRICPRLGQKQIAAVAVSIFFFTIVLTVLMLKWQKPVYARNQVFFDIPLDHQVYAECKNLLAYDGILLRANDSFSAYEEIFVDEFNQALLAAVRFNRCSYSESILVKDTKLTSELVENRIRTLADLTGRTKRLRQVEKRAFSDLTRFNLLSLVEEIFMR
jgi:ribosomal protein L32